jgi:general secretion pathway protein A
MVESHFGFRGLPFQLSPDPRFWYDSPGHAQALGYLRWGASQAEGFVVVTGPVGTGKTTLLAHLLEEHDPKIGMYGLISHTALQAELLPEAVALAFGQPLPAGNLPQRVAALEAYLTALAASGTRARLVVDEAQNLDIGTLEALRLLSNLQLGPHALLQCILVGQPELWQRLDSPELAPLRQRVIAACRLGVLDAEQTGAYMAHRQRCALPPGAALPLGPELVPLVHASAKGVPRCINLLCNRLLLAAALDGQTRVDPHLAQAVAAEWMAEQSGQPVAPESPDAPPPVEAS